MSVVDRNEDAAQLLAEARKSGVPARRMAEECRPADLDSAFFIQERVGKLLGHATGGWKCGLPKGGKTVAAPLYEPLIFKTSPCRVHTEGRTTRLEPEIAFVLGKDLLPRAISYTENEVRDAIVETRLAVELIGCRYSDMSGLTFLELLADALMNQGLLVGPVVSDVGCSQLDEIKIVIDHAEQRLVDNVGRHPDGHPLRPLIWLANFLSARGEPLKAGQIVTTGSYAGVVEVPLDTPLNVQFGDLGKFPVQLYSERNS